MASREEEEAKKIQDRYDAIVREMEKRHEDQNKELPERQKLIKQQADDVLRTALNLEKETPDHIVRRRAEEIARRDANAPYPSPKPAPQSREDLFIQRAAVTSILRAEQNALNETRIQQGRERDDLERQREKEFKIMEERLARERERAEQAQKAREENELTLKSRFMNRDGDTKEKPPEVILKEVPRSSLDKIGNAPLLYEFTYGPITGTVKHNQKQENITIDINEKSPTDISGISYFPRIKSPKDIAAEIKDLFRDDVQRARADELNKDPQRDELTRLSQQKEQEREADRNAKAELARREKEERDRKRGREHDDDRSR
jgi:hypothetical protein